MASLGQNRPEKFLPTAPAEQQGGLLKMDSGELSKNRSEGLDRMSGEASENNTNPNSVETSSQLAGNNNQTEIVHDVSADSNRKVTLSEEVVLEHLHGGAKVKDPAALLEQVLNLANENKTDSANKI
jgi:hypothetical protein